MFLDDWLRELNPPGKRALVLAAGGGADVVFVRLVAERLWCAGAVAVDLLQALNRPVVDAETSERFGLVGAGKGDNDVVKRFSVVVPNGHESLRGKGMAIAAAIDWRHGERLVVAAKGGGCATVARRCWAADEPYDLAVAVDGGGDVLTGGPDNFDRVVLDRFHEAWETANPLGLLVIGLGADAASEEATMTSATISGWRLAHDAKVDIAACDEIEEILRTVNRLHPDPLNWRDSDRHWSHGLHVPQIVALAARSRFPAASRGRPYVLVPRKSERATLPTEEHRSTGQRWVVMNEQLLCTARWYRPNGAPLHG